MRFAHCIQPELSCHRRGSNVRFSLFSRLNVYCSPVPTTKPERGYKVYDTIRERGLRDCGKGNELNLANADMASLNQKRVISAKRHRWTIELRLAAPARSRGVAPFLRASRHETTSRCHLA